MRRTFLILGMTVVLLAMLVFWLRPRSRPHLLVITLDTTRADRLGCYGYSQARTPALDSLAAAGLLCERAYTVAPLTLPAHTSLFTGLFPRASGIRTNGRGRLDDSIPTLAETLRRQGYDTAAFVGAVVLNRKFGLDRGFQTYDDDLGDAGDPPSSDPSHNQRSGRVVVDAALEWLTMKHERPFFCWIHLFDPHAPYVPHTEMFGNEFAERPYDGEIAYVDRQIARLTEFLKSRSLENQTLVVVAGDHGEGLGDHGEQTHSFTLYDETLRVPLIMRLPERIPSGTRASAEVSLVDVSRTILDLLDLNVLDVDDSRRISGRTLRPVWAGGAASVSPCFGATDEPYLLSGWSPLRSLTEGHWKYIRTTRVELYDLQNDPQERSNLAEVNLEKLREMQSSLAAVEFQIDSRAVSAVPLTPAERRALVSLGYAGRAGDVPSEVEQKNLPDIKDMLTVNNAVDDARRLVESGSLGTAIARLREIVKSAPSHTLASVLLANALCAQSEFDEAIEVLRDLVAHQPNFPDAHNEVGVLLVRQGLFDEARSEFRRTLELDPAFVDAHLNLAKGCVGAGQLDEALSHLDAILEIEHCHSAAYQWRGRVLANLGRILEAIEDFRQGLKCAPNSGEAHHNLGSILARHGEAQEAYDHFSRAVQISPDSAEFQFAFGNFLLQRRRFEEAIVPLTKALELNVNHVEARQRLKEARQGLKGRSPKAE